MALPLTQITRSNQLTALAREYVRPTIADQVYGNIRLWHYLDDKGSVIESVDGFLEYHVPILYRKLNRAKFLQQPDESFNISTFDNVQNIKFGWTVVPVAVTVTEVGDIVPSSGDNGRMANHIVAKFDQAKIDLADLLGNKIYTAIGTNGEFFGLNAIADDGTNAATYGGLSRTTYTALKAQYDSTTAPLTVSQLHTTTMATTKGNETPDLYVFDKTLWGGAADVIDAGQRLTLSQDLEVGGDTIVINRRPTIWDDPVPAKSAYIINTGAMGVKVHRENNFRISEFVKVAGQLVYVSDTAWVGFIFSEAPRLFGRYTAASAFA